MDSTQLSSFDQTRELRGEVRDFRAFRNRLVAALGKKPVEFNHKLADLRTNGKAAEASLLTLLREIKETSGPHLQARHWNDNVPGNSPIPLS